MQNTIRWRFDWLDGAVVMPFGKPLVKQKLCKCRGLTAQYECCCSSKFGKLEFLNYKIDQTPRCKMAISTL